MKKKQKSQNKIQSSNKITEKQQDDDNLLQNNSNFFDEYKFDNKKSSESKKSILTSRKKKKKTVLEFEDLNLEDSEQQDLAKSQKKPKQQKRRKQSAQSDEDYSYQEENEQENIQQKKPKKKKYNTKENYEEMIKIVEEIRKDKTAAVDTQGAGMQADPKQPEHIQHWQVLTSLLLSVQTKDETTDMVMKRLVAEEIDVDKTLKMSDDELKDKIFEVNFNGKKVQYIKKCAKIIKEDYDGKIPNSYETIIKWPGVGPKIANLFMQIAYDKCVGISVDTHVNRISNRFGWVVTSTPEQTKKELEKFLDKKYWRTINPLLVGLGQTICKPQNPDCKTCLLNDKCEEGLRRMVGRKKI